MSICKLKKITICGLSKEKTSVLNALQDLGCLHLVSLKESVAESNKTLPEKPENSIKALKFLLDCPKKRHQVIEAKNQPVEQYVTRVLEIQQSIRDISDSRDATAARIKEVKLWGDFDFPPHTDLAGLNLWFYIVPVGKISAIPKKGWVWKIVHKTNRFAYLVVVSKQEPDPAIMPVSRTHTGVLSLTELKNNLNQQELTLEDLQAEREALTRWIFLITKSLAYSEDKNRLLNAAEKTLDADEVFAIQGWVAETNVKRVLEFTHQHQLATLVADPMLNESPPTLLENPSQFKVGENLVGFYQTPGYWDWDPAIPVFFSFSLFFAMIMSDAGYAGIMGIMLFIYWRRLGMNTNLQRLRILATTLTISSLVWGILVGSYFGITPDQFSLLGRLKVVEMNDFEMMMRLSICVGVLHLTMANFFKAGQLSKQGFRLFEPIGWIAIMWGAVLLWFDHTFTSPESWFLLTGKTLIGMGGLSVFLFSGERSIKKPVDVVLKIFDGLKSLAGVTRIFGDVLSYLRLFALGLASASLAITCNQLAMQAREIEGLGLLYSILIILIGHSLNLMLSLMGAVVHGMRLNCIEFFNWGLSHEGFPFKAFSKKEISK